MILDNWNY